MTARALGLMLAVVLALPIGIGASAQTYPVKPITTVVPFAAGGTNDIVARIVAQELSTSFGKQVMVENRTGGGGVIGWGAVARAAPDGYTLLADDMSFAIAAALLPRLPFNAKKDFAQISTAATVPFVMVVHPSVPANTVAEPSAFTSHAPHSTCRPTGAVTSTYADRPMPSCLVSPDARRAACSARSSA